MSQVLIGLVGDLFVCRDEPRHVFSEILEVLSVPDVVFGNLEGAYTDEPHPVPSAYGVVSAPAHNLDAVAEAGFHVLAMANNHILDVGYAAMLETRSRLQAEGISTCGAGESSDDARRPAIVDVDGLRVAFLAYASTFPVGYEARSNRPGIAPMRAYNLYNFWRDPASIIHAPGMQPHVTTVPDETDLGCLVEDIRRARDRADLVVTSFHWGDYTRPFHLTDHEVRTARQCIDLGADMVVGHHHHAVRGMEWYKGRPIMYGLGHFVFDVGAEWHEGNYEDLLLEMDPGRHFEQTPYPPGPREGWPLLPMHEDTRITLIAWATATEDGVSDVGFLPCRLTPDGLVHPLRLGSPGSNEAVRYLEACNRNQGLNSHIVSAGAPTLAGYETLRVVPHDATPGVVGDQSVDGRRSHVAST